MGEMADYLIEHADYDVGGVLEAPRKTGGSKRHIHQQPQLEMPCESEYILWCSMRGYNVAHAADIFRYIAQHIKRVR